MADVEVYGISVILESDPILVPNISVSGLSVVSEDNNPVVSPNVSSSGLSIAMNDDPIPTCDVSVSGMSAISEDTDYEDEQVNIRSLNFNIDYPSDPNAMDNVFLRSLSANIVNADEDMVNFGTVVNFLALTDTYIPPPVPESLDLSIIASKSIRYKDKYTMDLLAKHAMRTVGASGIMSPFELDSSNINKIVFRKGIFMHNGIIADVTEDNELSTSSPPLEPYYLMGSIVEDNLEESGYRINFYISEDIDENVLIATKNIDWTPAQSIKLSRLWKDIVEHSESKIHTTASLKGGINPTGSQSNPFICKATGNNYDFSKAHFINTLITTAIEISSSSKSRRYYNMFADSMEKNGAESPFGSDGTIKIPDPKFRGPLGVVSVDEDLVLETGLIRVVDDISVYVAFSSKSTRVDTEVDLTFDLSTNQTSYEFEGAQRGELIPFEDFSRASDGKYYIKSKINVPQINGDGIWVTRSDMPIQNYRHSCERQSSSVITIGGTGISSVTINTANDSSAVSEISIDSQYIRTSKSSFIFASGGLKSDGTIDNNMYTINIGKGAFINTFQESRDFYRFTMVNFGDTVVRGTGINLSGDKNDVWEIINTNTRSISSSINKFPSKEDNVISFRRMHVSNKSIHIYGQAKVCEYSLTTDIFRYMDDCILSYSESDGKMSDISARNRPLVSASGTMIEFNHSNDTFISKPSPASSNQGYSVSLSSNGTIIKSGGDSSSSVEEYREKVSTAIGWGVEWQ